MAKILIVAEHHGGKLNPSTAKCVSCARQIPGAELHVAVLSDDPAAVAADAAKLDGVSKVLAVANAANAQTLAAVLAPQVAALARDYSHVLAPSTTFGKDLLPRVAALLGEAMLSDVMVAKDAHTFERPIYAGNAIVTVSCPPERKVVATVRTASYAAAGDCAQAAAVESASPSAELPTHTRFV